jgi:hypothetical protein
MGNVQKLRQNLLIGAQAKYATLNTRQPYPLIDYDTEMWSDTLLQTENCRLVTYSDNCLSYVV